MSFRTKVLPYIGPLFSMLLALHWLFTEIAKLDMVASRVDTQNCRGIHE